MNDLLITSIISIIIAIFCLLISVILVYLEWITRKDIWDTEPKRKTGKLIYDGEFWLDKIYRDIETISQHNLKTDLETIRNHFDAFSERSKKIFYDFDKKINEKAESFIQKKGFLRAEKYSLAKSKEWEKVCFLKDRIFTIKDIFLIYSKFKLDTLEKYQFVFKKIVKETKPFYKKVNRLYFWDYSWKSNYIMLQVNNPKYRKIKVIGDWWKEKI